MKKRVKIEYDWWEAIIEIDDTEQTSQAMREQLLFWEGGKERISDEDGDIELAYVRMLSQELVMMSMSLNVNGIKDAFDEKEGWADLRGKHGVKLISCDTWEFLPDDFYVEAVSNDAARA